MDYHFFFALLYIRIVAERRERIKAHYMSKLIYHHRSRDLYILYYSIRHSRNIQKLPEYLINSNLLIFN